MPGHGPFFREIFIMKCSIIKIEESYGLSLLLGEANCCECDPIVVPKPRIGHGLNFEQINSEIPPPTLLLLLLLPFSYAVYTLMLTTKLKKSSFQQCVLA